MLYSRETIHTDIKAFLLKARDSVNAILDQSIFKTFVSKAQAAAGEPITGDITETVTDVSERFHLSETETSGVLQSLIKGGDLTKWGLVNAITATAHTLPGIDYDRSTELERVGGEVLSLRLAA
jgi:hypothetical protein